jgi:hypothetical protein
MDVAHSRVTAGRAIKRLVPIGEKEDVSYPNPRREAPSKGFAMSKTVEPITVDRQGER